jgi:hypothetical protein
LPDGNRDRLRKQPGLFDELDDGLVNQFQFVPEPDGSDAPGSATEPIDDPDPFNMEGGAEIIMDDFSDLDMAFSLAGANPRQSAAIHQFKRLWPSPALSARP